MADTGQDCREVDLLERTVLHRSRKRHSEAGRAAMRSTLHSSPKHTSPERGNNDNNEWQSDDEDLTMCNRSWQSKGYCVLERRPTSRNHHVVPTSPGPKRVSRMASNSNRRTSARGDQRWISLLERNNEELLSQIETLTSDASEIEKELKTQLQSAQQEIINMREQLIEQDKAAKAKFEQYESKFAFLRSIHGESLPSPVDRQSSTNWRPGGQYMTDHEVRKIVHERDSLRIRAKTCESELLKYKRRNASLAEQILHKRSLEMTVEGQNRYLLELSSALEESRRTSMSEPSLSPQLDTFPDTPILSPFLPDAPQFVSRRPVSFDGTQWAVLAHARRRSLMDMIETTTRPDNISTIQPATPPLTDPGDSPLREEIVSDEIGRHDDRPITATSNEDEVQVFRTQRKTRVSSASRPSLRRNESSLWAELLQDSAEQGNGAVKDSPQVRTTEPVENVTADTLDATEDCEGTVKACAVQSDNHSLPGTLQLLFQGWVWICFLALLAVAVGRIVRDGPDCMELMTRERHARAARVEKKSP